MSPEAMGYCLYYYPSINRFTDSDGTIIHNLLPYFQVWEIEKWKKTKDYGLIEDRFGNPWEFFYLEEEVEEHLCNHRCLWCPMDCELRTLWDKWEQEKQLIKGE